MSPSTTSELLCHTCDNPRMIVPHATKEDEKEKTMTTTEATYNVALKLTNSGDLALGHPGLVDPKRITQMNQDGPALHYLITDVPMGVTRQEVCAQMSKLAKHGHRMTFAWSEIAGRQQGEIIR